MILLFGKSPNKGVEKSAACGDKVVWEEEKEWRHLRRLMGRLKILEVAEQKKNVSIEECFQNLC